MSSDEEHPTGAEPTEEDTRSDGSDEDEPVDLTLEEQKQRARQARQQTKVFVFEWPDGAESRYEYRMLDEDEEEELRQNHSRTYRGRSGEMETELDRKDLHIGLIKKAVVSGPAGYKATKSSIDESTTPEMREQLSEAIQSFSRMDEVERAKFR